MISRPTEKDLVEPATPPETTVLADRVDGDPPAVLGLTTSEVMMVAAVSGLVVLPLAMTLAIALFGLMALALTGFLFLGSFYLGSVLFRRIKRNKPLDHYKVKTMVLWQRLSGEGPFLLRAGPWAVGRTLNGGRRR
ncbi:MAG TPA: DUF3487 family protein [Rhodobacteraceae bacterium]|nr:DUF3487 family protein [Paracoccaceae bacterium]